MKKRLRKKLHVGEFADLRFELTGKFTGIEDAKAEAFFTDLFQQVADCGCCLNGTVGPEEFDLEVITGPVDTDNETRRTQLLAILEKHPNITDLKATELSL